MMKTFTEEAKLLQDELVSWRRHIHQNPEVGMDTHNTAAFIKTKLEEMGYEAKYVAGTGVTAIAGAKNSGKCFLIRGDIDALPVTEEADVEFKSTNGAMHACGHDFHATMLLGAAKLLKAHEDEIPGQIKFMFQPAEENLKGAKAMVQDGILENPKVDAAAMFHVMTGMPLPTGTIVIPNPGPSTAASDWFDIIIKGKGGHGAMPHKSVDPLNVISHLHLALQELNSREIAPDDIVALTVGMMKGGTTSNVIPDTAEMHGTLRTYDKETRVYLNERIPQIAKSVAQTFRAEAEVTMIEGTATVTNDAAVTEPLYESLKEVFGNVIRSDQKGSGSEDFAYVSDKVPAVMMIISAGNSMDGYTLPVHHPKVVFDENVLSVGAAGYAVAALAWLSKNQ